MTTPPFMDTNVFVRLLTGDEPDHSPRALRFFDEIASGDVEAITSATVVFELVFTLGRQYGWSRQDITDSVSRALRPANLHVDGKDQILNALALFATQRRLSYADCYHLFTAQQLGCTEIMSFDRGMDRFPGLSRIEPPPLPAS